MSPEKPWQFGVLARLAGSVLLCGFTGPLLLALIDFHPARAKLAPPIFYAVAAASLALTAVALRLILRPWPEELPRGRMAGLAACIFFSLNLSAWAQASTGRTAEDNSIWTLVLSTLAFQGAAVLLVHWCVRQHETNWAGAFGFTRSRLGRAVVVGLLLALVTVPAGWLLQAACAKVLTLVHIDVKEQRMVEILRLVSSWPGRLYMGFATIVLAPVAEETLFRGILYMAVKQAGFPRVALWVTSLLFGALHGNLPSFLPLTLFAAALALAYEKTDSLLTPILAHAAFNAVNFVLLFVANDLAPSG